MAWIEVHQSLFTHRKTLELAELLEVPDLYASAHLIALWTWALDNAPDGHLAVSERIIARAAQWPHDPASLVQALLQTGFLETSGEGYIIHDWPDGESLLRARWPKPSHWSAAWELVRRLVIRRDGYVCALCGGKVAPDELDIDHVVPRSKGGSDEPENLQVAHRLCNQRKGNRI
jgi:hypothetical protein